jgi:rhamnosyltransferase
LALCSVSVALATCNGGRFLAEQLSDIAAQSLLPAELVVCDDASSDDTLSILEGFARSAAFPVRIHRNSKRLDYRANFIKCASLCSADIIAFCDQDDRWLPHKLERTVQTFADPEILMVFHNASVAADPDRPFTTLYPAQGGTKTWRPLTQSPWQFALGFTQAFRRSLLGFDRWWEQSKDQNFANERLAHDQWFFFLASVFGTLAYLPEPLAIYRQHPRNAFGWKRFAPSFATRLAANVGNAGRAIRHRAVAAGSRATILEKAANELEEGWREAALRGMRKYRELEARYVLRASLYEASGLLSRAKALTLLFRARAYGRDAWKLGKMALMMDCTIGLAGLYPRTGDAPIADHSRSPNGSGARAGPP